MALEVAFSIQGVGGWIDLEDPASGYVVHKDTRAQQTVTWRKQEVTSAYVEGAFVNEAVREVIVEPLIVYVKGDTILELDQRVTALTDALSQLQFEVRAQLGNLRETWRCTVADYTIETTQEYLHATMATVRAQVPRQPTVVKEEVVA
ncbi:MAG TPA: hypothetical protein VIT65_22320 [Microlunatus sp.]